MTNEVINVGLGATINLTDLIQSRMLIQGNSGSGKSALARKIIECTFGKVPFVVWDIEGEYYTLKELSADIVIIGGQYADVPLTMELAEKLPAFIIKNRLSVVVDLSDFKMGERVHFSKLFFEALMDLTIEYWTPFFFFLEECQTLAGEQEKQESYSAVKDLLTRGRKRGYCAIVITQRIGMLKKSIAAECNVKFIGKTVLDIDMDRSAKELGFSKAADRLKLRDLKRGHFYAYGSSLSPEFVHEVVIEKPKTTMVRAGTQIDFKPKKVAPGILEKLVKLSESAAQKQSHAKGDAAGTEKNDEIFSSQEREVLLEQLNETKAYVFELQNEIVELQTQSQKDSDVANKKSEQFNEMVITLEKLSRTLIGAIPGEYLIHNENGTMSVNIPAIEPQQALSKYQQRKELVVNHPQYKSTNGFYGLAITSGDGDHVKKIGAVKWGDKKPNSELTGGEKLILIACAQYPNGLERYQLTIMVGYKQSARDTYISRLKQKGYVDQSGSRIVATIAGKKALGSDYNPLPTGIKLRNYWLNRLTGGERKIFELLVSNYPTPLSRDIISYKTGYKQSARDTYISRLCGRELAELPVKGMVKASAFLF